MIDMLEDWFIPGTRVAQPEFTRGSAREAVTWAFTLTGNQNFSTLPGNGNFKALACFKKLANVGLTQLIGHAKRLPG
jgi:hypothetical protein